MKINLDIEQLKDDYVRITKAKFGDGSKEIEEAEILEDLDLVKRAKADGFDMIAYIDSVEYEPGENISAFEARYAAEKFFESL